MTPAATVKGRVFTPSESRARGAARRTLPVLAQSEPLTLRGLALHGEVKGRVRIIKDNLLLGEIEFGGGSDFSNLNIAQPKNRHIQRQGMRVGRSPG